MGQPLRNIFLLFFSFTCVSLSAQTYEVRGRVIEAENGQPMTGVNVAVVGNVQGTISDQQGNFVLRTSSTPPFTVQFSGSLRCILQ